jgi:hypothetical protein
MENPQNASEQRADREYNVAMTRFFREVLARRWRRNSAVVFSRYRSKTHVPNDDAYRKLQ